VEPHKEAQISGAYHNLSFTIVLVRPEHAANIGSVTRIMENFNFKKLVIFNPIESRDKILSYETQGYAMHGRDVLFNADIIEIKNHEDHIAEFKNFMKDFDFIIATTAKGKNYSNIRRLAIFPEDLALPRSKIPINIAILFGRESQGLTNEEISDVDLLLRIPTSNQYPTLNLSHACGIILYEIFKKVNILKIGRGKNPVLLADNDDRQILYRIIKNLIVKLKVSSYKKDKIFYAFRNSFGRNFMSKKELHLILGLFSKVNEIIDDVNLYEKVNKKDLEL